MSKRGFGWLGYSLDRTREEVKVQNLGDRILLLGRGSGGLSNLLAFASSEAGRKIIIFDIDGSISPSVHGYFRTFDYRSVLYEAFHLEGDDANHGQLVASAYTTALDLTQEEESILSSALQRLSEQNDLATPSSLYDVLGGVEGFRGFYVDKLRGKVGSLRLLESTRVDSFAELMSGGALVSFSTAPYPQAGELAAGLCVAKLLHLLSSSDERPDALMITAAHRLFRGLNRIQHSGRLMAHLLEAPLPLVLVSAVPALLNDRLVESMQVRVYSSDAWNARKSWREPTALANSYTVSDDRSGTTAGFVPRFVRPKRAAYPIFAAPSTANNPELTKAILEEVSKYDAANRQSIVSYLSPQFLALDVGAEVDRLHSQGHLILEPKEVGSGPRIFAFTVTESGRKLMERLTR